jgi:TetR/AcrR family transcriptional regulator
VKLTDQLVNAGVGTGPRGRRRDRAADPSRPRLFTAATHEFAARGFAATSVDRIAATARLNKAMIYYHFGSKAALYREILHEMFAAVGARVAAVAASSLPPAEKVRQFVEAIATEAQARPHFPPMWFREVAEGGQHLDGATLRDMAGILKSLTSILDEGVRARQFRPVKPILVHAGIVAPVLLFFVSDGIRRRIGRMGMPGMAAFDRSEVVAHVQRVTLGLLQQRTADRRGSTRITRKPRSRRGRRSRGATKREGYGR